MTSTVSQRWCSSFHENEILPCRSDRIRPVTSTPRPRSTTRSPAPCQGSSRARPRRSPGVISGRDPDAGSRYYAVENGEVVGYAVFGANGRVSSPVVSAGGGSVPRALARDVVLTGMRQRGLAEAWAAYRGDWLPCLISCANMTSFEKRTHDQLRGRTCRGSPRRLACPQTGVIEPVKREDIPQLIGLDPGVFADIDGPRARAILLEQSVLPFPGEPVRVEGKRESGQILGSVLAGRRATALPIRPRSMPPCPVFAWAPSAPSASGTSG